MMKHILCLLLLCLPLILPGMASGEEIVPCYWRLTDVQADTSTSPRYDTATADTDIVPLSSLNAADMVSAIPNAYHIHAGVTRRTRSNGVQGDFTLSGIPALAPGASGFRLGLSASMFSDDDGFYLYASLSVNGRRLVRVRNSGTWLLRTSFPRTATPGAQRRIRLLVTEINGLTTVDATFLYEAVPGTMLVDTNGDIVLYDLEGNETDRIPANTGEVVPAFAPSSDEQDTLLSAEVQDDGALVARISPDCGLTLDEIVALLPASGAYRAGEGKADTLAALEPNQDTATLYIAPDAQLPDASLRALITAALDLPDDAEHADAVETPTPAPLTYGELIARIKNTAVPDVTPTRSPEKDAHDARLIVIYNSQGLQGVAMTPGAIVEKDTLKIIEGTLSQLGTLNLTMDRLVSLFEGVNGIEDLSITPLTDGVMLSIPIHDAPALLDILAVRINALMPTPTAAPTAAPTASPAPTATAIPTAYAGQIELPALAFVLLLIVVIFVLLIIVIRRMSKRD